MTVGEARGEADMTPKHHGAAGRRLQSVAGEATTATVSSSGRMHKASARAAVGVASRGCVYLPRYAVYTDYRAEMRCLRDCSPVCYPDVG
jgi:hypothetical protein